MQYIRDASKVCAKKGCTFVTKKVAVSLFPEYTGYEIRRSDAGG